jgi:hypothetical protein
VGAPVPRTAKQTIDACLAAVCVSDDSSPWQVIKQRYAAGAFTPEEKARHALCRTGWPNLLIALGDVQMGSPVSLDGAIYAARGTAGPAIKQRGWS